MSVVPMPKQCFYYGSMAREQISDYSALYNLRLLRVVLINNTDPFSCCTNVNTNKAYINDSCNKQ